MTEGLLTSNIINSKMFCYYVPNNLQANWSACIMHNTLENFACLPLTPSRYATRLEECFFSVEKYALGDMHKQQHITAEVWRCCQLATEVIRTVCTKFSQTAVAKNYLRIRYPSLLAQTIQLILEILFRKMWNSTLSRAPSLCNFFLKNSHFNIFERHFAHGCSHSNRLTKLIAFGGNVI